MLGIYAIYLIARGDIAWYITFVPLISAGKYLFLSQKPDAQLESNQWAHYLAWFLTTPVMLFLIFKLNNFPLLDASILIALNQLMIYSGYVAYTQKDKKKLWDWFTIGCLAFLPIVYQLIQFEEGFSLVLLTLITWSLYPVIWYLSHEKTISIPIRNVFYSALDFTSKAGLVTLYLIQTGKFSL
jgi:bacteriorhodopsin